MAASAWEFSKIAFIEALESDLSGVLAAAITTGGYRAWVWYCLSPEVFAEGLHNAPQETGICLIDVGTEYDPEWGYFFNQVGTE